MDSALTAPRQRLREWGLTRRQVVRLAVVALALGAVIAVAPRVLELLSQAPVVCPMQSFLGLPCPGCGTTRAVFALASGRVVTSLALNPLGVCAWLYALVAAGRWTGLMPGGRSERIQNTILLLGTAAAFVAWGIGLVGRFAF